jgi:hypothetical protein
MRVDEIWFVEHNMLHSEFPEVYNPNTNPKRARSNN